MRIWSDGERRGLFSGVVKGKFRGNEYGMKGGDETVDG
jgi:hypothetical protein